MKTIAVRLDDFCVIWRNADVKPKNPNSPRANDFLGIQRAERLEIINTHKSVAEKKYTLQIQTVLPNVIIHRL